jgi:hypothetical protein
MNLRQGIKAALQELVGGGRTIEQIEQKCCRACLQNVSVEGARANGPFRENIGQFDAARQLFSHPLPFLTGTRKRQAHLLLSIYWTSR